MMRQLPTTKIKRMMRTTVKTRTLLQRVSLSCLEIRSRNERAINSTRNRIYSLKLFCFQLYRRRYLLFVSELIQYACQRRPEIRLRSQAIRVYKYRKIQGPRFQKNYIVARDKKIDLHGTSIISIIVENKSHANHKSHLHTMKVYNTRPSLFC